MAHKLTVLFDGTWNTPKGRTRRQLWYKCATDVPQCASNKNEPVKGVSP